MTGGPLTDAEFLGKPGNRDVLHTIGKNLMKIAAKIRFLPIPARGDFVLGLSRLSHFAITILCVVCLVIMGYVSKKCIFAPLNLE